MKITRYTHRYAIWLTTVEFDALRKIVGFAYGGLDLSHEERMAVGRWTFDVDRAVEVKGGPPPEARARGLSRINDATGT